MPRLARTNTIVAPDLPGLGDSGAPKTSYTGQDVSMYLYKLVKGFSPDAKFDLVAHDIGIWNTYPMLANHQADISRVVYLEAPIPDTGLYDYPAFSPKGESLVWRFSFFAAKGALAETLVHGKEAFFWQHFHGHPRLPSRGHDAGADLSLREIGRAAGAVPRVVRYYQQLNDTIRLKRSPARTQADDAHPCHRRRRQLRGRRGRPDRQITEQRRIQGHRRVRHLLPEECAGPADDMIVGFLDAHGH